MELPKYLQTLLAYKWVFLVGIVFAVLAGFFATFTLQNGEVVSRAEKSYRAATTIMLNTPTRPIYQSQFRVKLPLDGVTTENRDLDSVAPIYAYIISGSAVKRQVEASVGRLRTGETIQAAQRTTQPGADPTTQGRLSLPLIDVTGISPSPQRAEALSRAASEAFQRDAVAQQDAEKLKTSDRVIFTTLIEGSAVEQDGSNPAIPGIAAGLGVIVLFAFAIFIIDSVRAARRRVVRRMKNTRSRHSDTSVPTTSVMPEPEAEAETEDRERSKVGSGAGI